MTMMMISTSTDSHYIKIVTYKDKGSSRTSYWQLLTHKDISYRIFMCVYCVSVLIN